MLSLEKSVIINRPVEEVFEFVMNPENESLWNPGTQKAEQTSDGPMGVGTTIHFVARFLGRTVDSEFEVIEYEANRKRVNKSISGPYPYEVTNLFESAEGGTKFTATAQFDIGGFYKLAEPLVARMADRQIESSFANLKDLLEAAG